MASVLLFISILSIQTTYCSELVTDVPSYSTSSSGISELPSTLTTLAVSAAAISSRDELISDEGSGEREFELIQPSIEHKNETRDALKSEATEQEPVLIDPDKESFVPVSIRPRSPTPDISWGNKEQPIWEREYRKHRDDGSRVQHIEAECQDDFMKIRVGFNGSFYGLLYSAGYAYDPDCMYINGTGRDYYEFYIQLNRCGTLGRNLQIDPGRKNPTNLMWNTITVQYNPLIEEELDEHFKVTCEYGYDFWKTVTFPFLDVEVATGNPVVFTLQPPECYMEIRAGYGAGGARVAGPVRVGDPLTLLIYMRSAYDGFDIVVNDCFAHNGANKRIQLIDEYGCPIDDKLISRFRGSWSESGVFETQVYAYMKTFRFTGSPALYIECDVRMCHGRCPTIDSVELQLAIMEYNYFAVICEQHVAHYLTQPCHWRNMKSVKKRSVDNMLTGNVSDPSQRKVNTTHEMKTDASGVTLSENINLFQSLRVLQEGEEDIDKTTVAATTSNMETCMKTSVVSSLLAGGCIILCMLSGSLLIACSKLRRARKPHLNDIFETYVQHKGRIK